VVVKEAERGFLVCRFAVVIGKSEAVAREMLDGLTIEEIRNVIDGVMNGTDASELIERCIQLRNHNIQGSKVDSDQSEKDR
jgi:hypothetical protein